MGSPPPGKHTMVLEHCVLSDVRDEEHLGEYVLHVEGEVLAYYLDVRVSEYFL